MDTDNIEILVWAAGEYLEYLEQSKKYGNDHPFLDKDIANIKKALTAYNQESNK